MVFTLLVVAMGSVQAGESRTFLNEIQGQWVGQGFEIQCDSSKNCTVHDLQAQLTVVRPDLRTWDLARDITAAGGFHEMLTDRFWESADGSFYLESYSHRDPLPHLVSTSTELSYSYVQPRAFIYGVDIRVQYQLSQAGLTFIRKATYGQGEWQSETVVHFRKSFP